VPGAAEKKKKISLDFSILTEPNISDFRGPCHDTLAWPGRKRKKKKTFLLKFLSRQNLTYRVSGVHANIRHKGDAVNRKKRKKKIHFPLATG
jgi:hypothetical protein